MTFRLANSAKRAVEALNGVTLDGVKLKVSVLRKNMSWCTGDNASSKLNFVQNRGRSVHLTYRGRITADDVESFFQTVGRVTRIYLNEMKHFGFATFENEEQAQRAIREMNGEFFNGNKIIVSPQKYLNSDSIKVCAAAAKSGERQLVSYVDI